MTGHSRQQRHPPRRLRLIGALLLLGALTAACGGSNPSAPDGLLATVLSDPPPVRQTVTPGSATRAAGTATPAPTQPPTQLPTQPAPSATATVTATTAASPARTAAPVEPTPTMSPIPSGSGDDRPVIVLDPGHDRTTPGALGTEYQMTLRTGFVAQAALEAAGYVVHLTRTDNETVFVEDESLLPDNRADFHPGYSHAYAHASKALQFDPDMVFVLHYNGHPDPAVDRLELYYCENGGPQNLVLAEIMADELLVALDSIGVDPSATLIQEDLGVARGNRHFPSLGNVYDAPRTFLYNRYAGIPVVVTEALYMTNPTSLALLEEESTHLAIAEAYVRAANRYFGR